MIRQHYKKMHIKELKTVFILFCLMYFILPAHAQDTTPPVFQSLWIENDTVFNGDSVEIFIRAYDSQSDIDRMELSLRNQYDGLVYSLFFPDYYPSSEYNIFTDIGDNIFKLKYPISKWAASCKTIIESIVISDNSSNIFYSGTYPIDSFYVLSDSPDTLGPELISISVNPDTVKIKETVTLNMEITDDVSGFYFCNYTLLDEENNKITYYFGNYVNNQLLQIGTNNYTLDVTIPYETKRGYYHFRIGFLDKQDNETEYDLVNNVFFVDSDIIDNNPFVNKASVKIYPNPTNGHINIVGLKTEDVKLRIISLDGKVVQDEKISSDKTYDLTGLPHGFYQIIINKGENVLTRQIILNGH
ncbi:MAG: T9SS type A sorting domain-containing protein [Prolixibacteraceae bacterium]|nr:T9SS type A sorting domain-containing protein [Prolixibacteraceae bacterium]